MEKLTNIFDINNSNLDFSKLEKISKEDLFNQLDKIGICGAELFCLRSNAVKSYMRANNIPYYNKNIGRYNDNILFSLLNEWKRSRTIK